MDTNSLENKVKARLLADKEKHKQTLLSLQSQDPYSDPDRLTDNAASDTEAKEESSHERMEALEKELKAEIEEIDSALSRLEQGTYGKCQNCGQNIDSDRLAVKPMALYCVSCEEKRSQTQ